MTLDLAELVAEHDRARALELLDAVTPYFSHHDPELVSTRIARVRAKLE